MGTVQDGTRLMICGGLDVLGDISFTCYYINRYKKTNMQMGGAPRVDVRRSGACHASDGNFMVFVGGEQQEGRTRHYTGTGRVLT